MAVCTRLRIVWPCDYGLQLSTLLLPQRGARSFLSRLLFVLCCLRARCQSRRGCCLCSSWQSIDGCWRARARVGVCGVHTSLGVLLSLCTPFSYAPYDRLHRRPRSSTTLLLICPPPSPLHTTCATTTAAFLACCHPSTAPFVHRQQLCGLRLPRRRWHLLLLLDCPHPTVASGPGARRLIVGQDGARART